MSDVMTDWQKINEQYLSSALNWLRLRLQCLADSSDGGDPLKNDRKIKAELKTASASITAAAANDPPPALVILSRQFRLSPFEQNVLLLCAAMELDTRLPALCAQAQDDSGRPYPSFALAMALFDDPSWDILSPDRPLRYWRLIEINRVASHSLITSPLRADERIVNYLKGLNHLDERLVTLLAPFDVQATATDLSPSQQHIVTSVVRCLQASGSGRVPVIQLVGSDTQSKQLVAQQAAVNLGLHLSRLLVEMLPSQADELEALTRLWQRESFLLPVAVYLDAHEPNTGKPEGETHSQARPLHRFLSRSRGVFFVSSRELQANLGPSTISLDVNKPTPSEQASAWTSILGNSDNRSPSLLAGQFNLNVTTIRSIARRAADDPESNGDIPHDQLWDACLASTGPQLDILAQRIEPVATWEDIVLPQEAVQLLHQIADQVRQRSKVYDTWGFRKKLNRGLGISALFTGDSGTGKTMAAEVIANDLRLNLYRIDLSGVVSKYIGETEKNLRRLFDAAEDGGAILFFDEADALFGKRSEVKDSHDRYANIEINYLLQRMEAYNGLAILATNRKSALDTAFMRRLRFIVNFPFPGVNERKIILKRVFPSEVPTEDLDYDRLARLNLSGGSICNIAINAAFMAAQQNSPVTMPVILAAAKTEFRKLERSIKEDDFLWKKPEQTI